MLSLAGAARIVRFVPRSVMVGFVDALAILIFLAQVPDLTGVPWLVSPMVAAGVAIMVGFPRITSAVPAPLVVIVALTTVALSAASIEHCGRAIERFDEGSRSWVPERTLPVPRRVSRCGVA